jgi:phosphoribosylformylglycinamidine synthase
MDVKNVGDWVYVLGITFTEDLGASHYFAQTGCAGGHPSVVRDSQSAIQTYRWLHRSMKSQLVASCHDVSDGGLGVALAESAFAGDLGIVVDLRQVPRRGVDRDEFILFSESPCRFVVTVKPPMAQAFEVLMGGAAEKIGYVTADKRLVITGTSGDVVVDADIGELKQAWQSPLSFEEVN